MYRARAWQPAGYLCCQVHGPRHLHTNALWHRHAGVHELTSMRARAHSYTSTTGQCSTTAYTSSLVRIRSAQCRPARGRRRHLLIMVALGLYLRLQILSYRHSLGWTRRWTSITDHFGRGKGKSQYWSLCSYQIMAIFECLTDVPKVDRCYAR